MGRQYWQGSEEYKNWQYEDPMETWEELVAEPTLIDEDEDNG